MPQSHQLSQPARTRIPVRALLAVALGGLIGSAVRVGVVSWLGAEVFPAGVLIVNLAGSFLLGLYVALRQRVVGRSSPQFWAVGVFGSFTTFSAFTGDVVRLAGDGHGWLLLIYLSVSMVGGLILGLLGIRIGRVVKS